MIKIIIQYYLILGCVSTTYKTWFSGLDPFRHKMLLLLLLLLEAVRLTPLWTNEGEILWASLVTQAPTVRRAGMKSEDVLDAYKTTVHPVIDFACVVYNSLITVQQSNELERMQKSAIRIIYSENYKSCEIESLWDRRVRLSEMFTRKSADNPHFKKWFREKARNEYNARTELKYLEERQRTNRMMQIPVFKMRKLLNRLWPNLLMKQHSLL